MALKPKDILDTVAGAGKAAVSEVTGLAKRFRRDESDTELPLPPPRPRPRLRRPPRGPHEAGEAACRARRRHQVRPLHVGRHQDGPHAGGRGRARRRRSPPGSRGWRAEARRGRRPEVGAPRSRRRRSRKPATAKATAATATPAEAGGGEADGGQGHAGQACGGEAQARGGEGEPGGEDHAGQVRAGQAATAAKPTAGQVRGGEGHPGEARGGGAEAGRQAGRGQDRPEAGPEGAARDDAGGEGRRRGEDARGGHQQLARPGAAAHRPLRSGDASHPGPPHRRVPRAAAGDQPARARAARRVRHRVLRPRSCSRPDSRTRSGGRASSSPTRAPPGCSRRTAGSSS